MSDACNWLLTPPLLLLHTIIGYQGESDTGADAPFQGPSYYKCALGSMVADWRSVLRMPTLPFLLVELSGAISHRPCISGALATVHLVVTDFWCSDDCCCCCGVMWACTARMAAYCNEHDSRTFRTWCDQNTSAITSVDYHLPAMRMAQRQAAAALPLVYVETAADLGSIHPHEGSIHSARKKELGARLALAAEAAASAKATAKAGTRQHAAAATQGQEVEVLWAGPEAVSAAMQPSGKVAVRFHGELSLNRSAACPAPMQRSPLGKLCCTGAGFEVQQQQQHGGTWAAVLDAMLDPADVTNQTILLVPPPTPNRSDGGSPPAVGGVQRVRYAFADWPVCSVRNARDSGGSTTSHLPARIFDIAVGEELARGGDPAAAAVTAAAAEREDG